VLESAHAQARLQAQRDLGEHVGELLLYQLEAGQRSVELLPERFKFTIITEG